MSLVTGWVLLTPGPSRAARPALAGAEAPAAFPRPAPAPAPVRVAAPDRHARMPVLPEAHRAKMPAAPRPPAPAAAQPGVGFGSCPDLPAGDIWHADVSRLPVASASARYVASIGASRTVHADFGSGEWDGGTIGIPITYVGAGQAKVRVTFDYDDESDPGPYPIPSNALVEGGSNSDGDRHVLVVDSSACQLYELYDAHPNADGSWHAGSGAIYDLRSDKLRPSGWTSADAAGLPIVPGLVRYEEVAAGRIDHAIRVTAPRTRNSFVWPARHAASSSTDASLPPMGQRLRLKASVNIANLPPQARIVAQAMKTYGVILADNGSPWFISGTPDSHWDNDALHALAGLSGNDFEAVDVSSLMVDPNSGRTR